MLQITVDQLPARILVVDDDDDTREMLRELLHSSGYDTLFAPSGEEAVALIEHESVDSVLLDLRLPGIDGYEVCRRLRNNMPGDVPILMMTANWEAKGVVHGLRIGADDYLAKPFVPDELLSRLDALLRRHRSAMRLITENEALRDILDQTQRELADQRASSSTESTLRREFLHNVTTHLRALCGVIESEYRRAPLGQSREIVQRILGRVQGATLVYETSNMLQDDPTRIDSLLHVISTALKNIYAPRRRLPVSVRGEPLELPLAYAAPVAMIINELVTNCFKHAFPNGRFGSIAIEYTCVDNLFALRVADDGVGLPAGASTVRRGQSTVRHIAQNLGGDAVWNSGPDGTVVEIRFPYRPTEEEAADQALAKQ
jgi:DNA-binding response OmpR family regulator/anti-sigma regulatory factor (Ser/Thr protein kinase)